MRLIKSIFRKINPFVNISKGETKREIQRNNVHFYLIKIWLSFPQGFKHLTQSNVC